MNEIENEIENEIRQLLDTMFPTPEQRTGGPDSTFQRVNRLILLGEKLALTWVSEKHLKEDIRDLDEAIKETMETE